MVRQARQNQSVESELHRRAERLRIALDTAQKPQVLWSDPMSDNRFHDIAIDDLNTLRAALVHWLPTRAQAVVDEATLPEEGSPLDYLKDVIRLIQELDDAIAIEEKRPIVNLSALETGISSPEDLQKMYDQLPRQDD